MEEVRIEKNPNEIRIYLSGRIDSNNADEIKNAILPEIGSDPEVPVVVDASELKYISSAGLRVFLQIRKAHPDMKIINTSVAIYEILEITGFTEMIDVSKKYRSVSIDNCKVIGRGAAGTIYRLNKECIVKVNHDPDSLDDIKREYRSNTVFALNMYGAVHQAQYTDDDTHSESRSFDVAVTSLFKTLE